MKMWSGRFTKNTNKLLDDFNSSLPFDIRLYKFDIEASIAHSKMLKKIGILSQVDCDKIIFGLTQICKDIENGVYLPDGEDVHMAVEGELTRRIGDAGKRLHTARSRNDQVATDFRLFIRTAIDEIVQALKNLTLTITKTAEQHTATVMSGYTHLQKAQPVTMGHYLMAYAEMFRRDILRLLDCRKRVNILPLGSAALAATTYPLDREYVASLLSFDGITQNSIDGVSDRDFSAEFLFCLSMVAMHLSRFSEEFILWNTTEFSYIELDDAFSTGSSIMPQKKNPDIPELIRGKTGRVYGDLMQTLTMLKGLPLAYNKDMQEDKESVFDAFDTVSNCVVIFDEMLKTTKFNIEKLRAGAELGYTNATEFADYLVAKGIPFRNAHEITGKLILAAINDGKKLSDFTLAEFKELCPDITEDIYKALDVYEAVKRRSITGGANPDTVKKHIENVRNWIKTI